MGEGGPRNPYHPHPNLPPSRGKEAQGLPTLSQKGTSPEGEGFRPSPMGTLKEFVAVMKTMIMKT